MNIFKSPLLFQAGLLWGEKSIVLENKKNYAHFHIKAFRELSAFSHEITLHDENSLGLSLRFIDGGYLEILVRKSCEIFMPDFTGKYLTSSEKQCVFKGFQKLVVQARSWVFYPNW